MKNKKLIFIADNLWPDDIERVRDELGKFLKSKEHTFMILSPFTIEKMSEDPKLVVLKLHRI